MMQKDKQVTYIVPFNITKYDIISHFSVNNNILIKTDKLMNIDDRILFYVAAPYKEIKYEGVVINEHADSDIIENNKYALDNNFNSCCHYVLIQLVRVFNEGFLPLKLLKELGIGQVLRQCRANERLLQFIDNEISIQ